MADKSIGTESFATEKKKIVKKRLRLAFIGCGGICQTHIAAIAKIPELEIVAGCDIDPERLEVMKTKDSYGRDVVDPTNGIYVRFDDFGDSSVNVAVKQYVLVAERVAYVDKAKEVIYEALNEAGITIPFPQCDLHIIADEA